MHGEEVGAVFCASRPGSPFGTLKEPGDSQGSGCRPHWRNERCIRPALPCHFFHQCASWRERRIRNSILKLERSGSFEQRHAQELCFVLDPSRSPFHVMFSQFHVIPCENEHTDFEGAFSLKTCLFSFDVTWKLCSKCDELHVTSDVFAPRSVNNNEFLRRKLELEQPRRPAKCLRHMPVASSACCIALVQKLTLKMSKNSEQQSCD